MGVSKECSQKIKNMSIVCAMLVVTIHVCWPTDTISATWLINELFAQGIARIAVPFFFVVSGFFLSSHFDEKHWWKSETNKRIHSLVIPFFVWGIISFSALAPLSIIADAIAHRPFGTNLQLSEGRWMHTFGLDVDKTPGLTPLWYVRCLFFFVIASPIFKLMIERLKLKWLLLTFLISTIFSWIPVDPENRPFWNGFLYYGLSLSGIFYFSVGIYIQRFNISIKSRPLAILCAVYGIGYLIVKTYIHAKGLAMPIGIGCLVLPALMYFVWSITPVIRFPTWITSCSFSIFLLHCIFLDYAGIILKHCPLGEQTSKVLSCVFAIVGPIILTNIIRRIAPRLTAFLFAGRS